MPAPDRRPTSCWRANSFAAGATLRRRRRQPQHEVSSMSQAPKPRGLGRGLSALLGDDEVAATLAPTPAPAPAAATVEAGGRAAASRAPQTLPTAYLRP